MQQTPKKGFDILSFRQRNYFELLLWTISLLKQPASYLASFSKYFNLKAQAQCCLRVVFSFYQLGFGGRPWLLCTGNQSKLSLSHPKVIEKLSKSCLRVVSRQSAWIRCYARSALPGDHYKRFLTPTVSKYRECAASDRPMPPM